MNSSGPMGITILNSRSRNSLLRRTPLVPIASIWVNAYISNKTKWLLSTLLSCKQDSDTQSLDKNKAHWACAALLTWARSFHWRWHFCFNASCAPSAVIAGVGCVELYLRVKTFNNEINLTLKNRGVWRSITLNHRKSNNSRYAAGFNHSVEVKDMCDVNFLVNYNENPAAAWDYVFTDLWTEFSHLWLSTVSLTSKRCRNSS